MVVAAKGIDDKEITPRNVREAGGWIPYKGRPTTNRLVQDIDDESASQSRTRRT